MSNNPNQGQILFTAEEVLRIREQHANGTLSVRSWGDIKQCSLETIRKICRFETYRHVKTAEDSTRRGLPRRADGAGERKGGGTEPLASATPPRWGEPTEAEMDASFARLHGELGPKEEKQLSPMEMINAIRGGKV